jgi:DNA-binding transcriptional ArsR family regulator
MIARHEDRARRKDVWATLLRQGEEVVVTQLGSEGMPDRFLVRANAKASGIQRIDGFVCTTVQAGSARSRYRWFLSMRFVQIAVCLAGVHMMASCLYLIILLLLKYRIKWHAIQMETKTVVKALAALAQESRLAIFRLLMQAGPEGVTATRISEQVGVPPSSLSFHLKELVHAQLINSRQEGRFMIYSANYTAMNQLLRFLTDNCCGGNSCTPVKTTSARKKAQHA